MKENIRARIISNECIFKPRGACAGIVAGQVNLMRLEFPEDICVEAGQFFQVDAGKFLRRPISVCEIKDDSICLAIRAAGEGTMQIISREVGEFLDLLGPMGRGYQLPSRSGRYLIIGGGIGVAPQLPVADYLKESGFDFDFVAGYRNVPYLTELATKICIENAEDFENFSAKTDTLNGNVTNVVKSLLEEHEYKDIFICGPERMIESLVNLCVSYDPQVLLEEAMACAVGACLGCTKKSSTGGFVRVCKDGPSFRASEICFDFPEVEILEDAEHERYSDQIDLSVDLNGLELKNPVTLASGICGFGQEYSQYFDMAVLGAISVKGLTLLEKLGNDGRRVVETDSGMINSVGLQNPGVEHFIKTELPRLKADGVTVIANINGNTIEEMQSIARIVGVSEVDSLELNISCPNVKSGGMSFGTDPYVVRDVVSAVRSSTKKHLIVKLSPNVTDIKQIALICEECGADALSLINTVSGMTIDIKTGKKHLLRGKGGLSGPAIKPIAIGAVYDVTGVVKIPVLGMGGIAKPEDALEFLLAGASAVAIGSAMFSTPLLPIDTLEYLRDYLLKSANKTMNGIKRIK